MKVLLLLLLAPFAQAGNLTFGNSVSLDVADLNGQSIMPATVGAATITITQNGVTANAFPANPLNIAGNTNSNLQVVIQNQSNGTNATSDICATSDLGSNTSNFGCFGINSSKNNGVVDGFTAWQSSGFYAYSADAPFYLWGGTNGGLNGGAGTLVLGSSTPVAGNVAAVIMNATSAGPGALVVLSTASFLNGSFGVGGSSFTIAGGSATVAYQMAANVSLSSSVVISTASGSVTMVAVSSSASTSLKVTVTGSGTSPASIFTPSLSSFTVTGALSGTFTNTALGPCLAGSSVTLNLPVGVGNVYLGFHGGASGSNLANVILFGYIMDGAFQDGESSTKGMTAFTEQVAANINDVGFNTILTGIAAGQHNFCLTASINANTGTIDSTNSLAKFFVHMLP